MFEEKNQRLIGLLKRIPIFQDLTLEECRKLLAVCEKVAHPAGKTIFAAGAPGNQLLILLGGRLSIQTPGGLEITQIKPVDSVGEMEIVNGLSRVARVVAMTEISGLTLGSKQLGGLLGGEPVLGVKILKNIIGNLAKKLKATNLRLMEKN